MLANPVFQGSITSRTPWIPLVTFNVAPPGTTRYVVATGSGSGWLYGEGVPRLVSIVATQPGGVSGTLVKIGAGPIAFSNPGPTAGDDTLVADLGTVQCCVDAQSMRLVCSDTTSSLHDAEVTEIMEIHAGGLVTISFIDPNDGFEKNTRLPLCPDGVPQNCCYDAISGVLVCPGDPRDGMTAVLIGSAPTQAGELVIVALPDSTQLTVPLCDDPPSKTPCPPGYLVDATGECIPPPPPPPPPGDDCEPDPCCDECAIAMMANPSATPCGGARANPEPCCDECAQAMANDPSATPCCGKTRSNPTRVVRQDCVATIDGQTVMLFWKSANQVKPNVIPVKVVECKNQKGGSMPCHGVASPQANAPQGIDRWIPRCSGYPARAVVPRMESYRENPAWSPVGPQLRAGAQAMGLRGMGRISTAPRAIGDYICWGTGSHLCCVDPQGAINCTPVVVTSQPGQQARRRRRPISVRAVR